MAKIVMIGGGVAGLIGSVLLARDGHHVTLLEGDPAPPPAPTDAWDRWERRGVTQFRLPHAFLPRFREVLDHDLSPGARVSYFMTGPDGGKSHGYWDIVAVDPPHRLEVQDGFADDGGEPNDTLGPGVMVVTLADCLQDYLRTGITPLNSPGTP